MRTADRRIAVPLLAAALALLPAAASAQDDPSTGGTAAPEAAPAEAISATPHVLVGKVARFSGSFQTHDAGSTVTIERFDEKTLAWAAVTTAQVQPDGSYSATWVADLPGRHRTRASLASAPAHNPDGGAAAFSAASGVEASMTVYRPARASWYGPGFYGRRTACGQRMTRTLLGVAHRSLPCGSQIAINYDGRSITVPVVDRGPYVRGRRWDLTAATAKALGFTFTDRVGAVRIG
jgi:rare lipoprotein A